MIGSQPEALALQDKALAVRRELAMRPASDSEALLDVARSLLAEGLLQNQTGDVARAMQANEEAPGRSFGS